MPDTGITRPAPELQGIAVPIESDLPYSASSSGDVRARYDFEIPNFADVAALTGCVAGGVACTGESLSGIEMDACVAEDTMQRVYQVSGSKLEIEREAGAFLGAAPGTDLLDGTGIPDGRYVQEDFAIVSLAFGVIRHERTAEPGTGTAADIQ